MQQKVVLNLNNLADYNEISSPSISVHTDDVNSNEATDTFFDMLSCMDASDQLDSD